MGTAAYAGSRAIVQSHRADRNSLDRRRDPTEGCELRSSGDGCRGQRGRAHLRQFPALVRRRAVLGGGTHQRRKAASLPGRRMEPVSERGSALARQPLRLRASRDGRRPRPSLGHRPGGAGHGLHRAGRSEARRDRSQDQYGDADLSRSTVRQRRRAATSTTSASHPTANTPT